MMINDLYEKQMRANKKYKEDVEQIKGLTETYTAEELSKRIAEREKAYKAEKTANGVELVKAFNSYRVTAHFDEVLLDNPKFIGLLQAVQLFGKDTPKSIINTAIMEFKEHQGTMRAIEQLLSNAGVTSEALKKLIISDEDFSGAIAEANGYENKEAPQYGAIYTFVTKQKEIKDYVLPEYKAVKPTTKFF